jgi:seryl-tRNA synthetase
MEEQQVDSLDVKEAAVETDNEDKQPVDGVPYARFQEVNDAKNTLRDELDSLKQTIEKEAEDRKLKELESKGEYETIMKEMKSKLDMANNKAAAFDDYQTNRRDTLLSLLPEADRDIYNGLPLEKLEVHVERLKTRPKPASTDNAKPSAMGGFTSFEEWAVADPKGYEQANNAQTSGKIKVGYGK